MVSHSFWEMNCRLLIIDKCAEHQKWNFYNSCCCCCCCWHLCFHILMFMRWRLTVQFHFPSPLFVSYNQPSACVVASVVSNEPTPLSTRQGKRQSNSPPFLSLPPLLQHFPLPFLSYLLPLLIYSCSLQNLWDLTSHSLKKVQITFISFRTLTSIYWL